MVLTSRLGSTNSMLGNIRLGAIDDSGSLTRSVSDTLSFTEAYELSTLYGTLFDILVLPESYTCQAINNYTVTDTLTLSDRFAINFYISDTLVFSDDTYVAGLAINDVLVYRDSFKIQLAFRDNLVLDDIFRRDRRFEVVDSLILSDQFYHNFILNDSVSYSETINCQHIIRRLVTDSLVLIDTLLVKKKVFLTITDSLILDDDLYGAIADRYLVIIGPSNTVYLPPPEFNDYYKASDKTIIKRSMVGEVRTYNKTTEQERLHYDLVMTRRQMLQLRQLLDNDNRSELIILDQRGYRYKVKLLNNTVEFTETARWAPSGNKVQTTLEFIGKRYAN